MLRTAVCTFFLASLLRVCGLEIIAHRGASADAPENTLSAMKLGWEQGADAVELDLWLSKDGQLVVFHDADTRRFEKKARKVPTLTWDELQALDVGGWKGERFKGERIPRLEPILATIPKGRRAVLEIKCGPEILPELKRVLRAAGKTKEELAIITFNYETLKESKKMFPEIEHLFLHGYKQDPGTKAFPELKPIIALCKEAKCEGLNLNYEWPIDPAFVKEVRAAGLKLYVWTVNDAAIAKRLARLGIDGITTDRPAWLRKELK